MSVNFSFNGFSVPTLAILREESRPVIPAISTLAVDVPRRDGSILRDRKLLPRILTIPFIVRFQNLEEFNRIKTQMAANWFTKEPGTLIFTEEPTIEYYGVLMDFPPLESYPTFARGTVTFICHDPFKYSSAHRGMLTMPFTNSGTAESAPTFLITLSEAATEFTVENHDGERLRLVNGFREGDYLEIDVGRRLIRINGEIEMTAFDFTSRWPMVKPGINNFQASQPGLMVYYRERWF